MNKPFRTEKLDNGLVVEFFDLSNRYYGNFHRLCVQVRCAAPLTAELFASESNPDAAFKEALDRIGPDVVFTRTLEKMGVAGDDLPSETQALVESFVKGALGYMGQGAFLRKLVETKLAEKAKPVRRPYRII